MNFLKTSIKVIKTPIFTIGQIYVYFNLSEEDAVKAVVHPGGVVLIPPK